MGSLPRWHLDFPFPGLNSPEFEEALARIRRDVESLQAFFDEHGIRKPEKPIPTTETVARVFEEALRRLDQLGEDFQVLSSYVHAHVSTNSRDSLAQARMSEIQALTVPLMVISTRFTAWLGSLDHERLMELSPRAREHRLLLEEARVEAQHQMSVAEEQLAAEFSLVAGSAWGRFYGTYTSQITVPVKIKGEEKTLPMSVLRTLSRRPDPEVRRAAYEAELRAWEQHAMPLAAALNGVKGEVLILTRHRNWPSPLDEALFQNRIQRQTLDAMLTAAREYFPVFRDYLRAKARALGHERLPWYDLFAPLGRASRTWTFEEAQQFILEQFGTYSEKLRRFGERAFAESWIDAEPREGKRDGGFCMRYYKDQSRILVNFDPSFNSVRTLAHELGHAYHNLQLSQHPPTKRETPMTLSETASTFTENLVTQAYLHLVTDPQEKLYLLEASLQHANQIVVDITSRFLFEQAVFERRSQRELTVPELRDLMLQAQEETYGDALHPEFRHPYAWASKPHYYSSRRSFYNFPYMFGELFGLGLVAEYERDPQGFRERYDDLLASTGLYTAEELTARFGFDIQSPDFWRRSLETLARRVWEFQRLLEER